MTSHCNRSIILCVVTFGINNFEPHADLSLINRLAAACKRNSQRQCRPCSLCTQCLRRMGLQATWNSRLRSGKS